MSCTQSVKHALQTLPRRPLESSHTFPTVLYLESIELPVKPTVSDALVGCACGILQHCGGLFRAFVPSYGALVEAPLELK